MFFAFCDSSCCFVDRLSAGEDSIHEITRSELFVWVIEERPLAAGNSLPETWFTAGSDQVKNVGVSLGVKRAHLLL